MVLSAVSGFEICEAEFCSSGTKRNSGEYGRSEAVSVRAESASGMSAIADEGLCSTDAYYLPVRTVRVANVVGFRLWAP